MYVFEGCSMGEVLQSCWVLCCFSGWTRRLTCRSFSHSNHAMLARDGSDRFLLVQLNGGRRCSSGWALRQSTSRSYSAAVTPAPSACVLTRSKRTPAAVFFRETLEP